MAEPFHLDAGTAVIGASVGIALHDGTESAEQLLRRADVAMYAVKRDGREGRRLSDSVPAASPAGR
jgi:predicted signal transduction protein with EAL and GGDEF domain